MSTQRVANTLGRNNMKSVTIKDSKGKILVKVLHRKNGEIDAILHTSIQDRISVDIRDNDNYKIPLFVTSGESTWIS
jgi:ribosomal protein L25 (general stress protein Ctc)